MFKSKRLFALLLTLSVVVFSNPALTLLAEETSGTDGVSTPPATEVTTPVEETTPPAETTPSTETTPAPEDTTTPAEETPAPSGDTVVETGDAVAGSNSETTTNTNDTTVDPEAPPTGNTGGEAVGSGGGASTDAPADADTETENAETNTAPTEESGSQGNQSGAVGSGGAAATDVTVTNTNTASTTNETTTNAETGNNTASSTSGTGSATVNTGNAYSYANVINVLNTNIFNSQGFFLFLNSFFGGGTLNLSSLSFLNPDSAPQATYCSLGGCEENSAEYVLINNNQATINNDVVVRASTGGNTAASDGGTAAVNTGNAYAAANVVNLANTNIVDSNYLLLSFNNFGDMNGDIVLPNADFFSNLFGNNSGVGGGSSVQVSNTNTANVTNNVGVTADTGNNTASTSGDGGTVTTGNANANAGVMNVINTNETGGTSVFLLFRVFGDWAGSVFNAPPGIEWAPTANGITLFSSDGNTSGLSPLQQLEVTNNSTAEITNDVKVYALTGDNKAEAGAGSASVNTGNAYAAANVMNIANTNIVGRNWIFAIFNIFGNWKGNISFGQPNLWIGAVAKPQTSGYLESGTKVEYHFTVTNRGESTATNVRVDLSYDRTHLSFFDGGDLNIGTLAPGQTVEVVKNAEIVNLPYGDTPLPVKATATLHESDANTADNTEEVTIVGQYYVTEVRFGSAMMDGIPVNAGMIDPKWEIKKTVSETAVTASSTVDYTIVLTNTGATAYHATLFDTVTDEAGNIIFEQTWDLGTFQHNEEATVTYSVFFHPGIPNGKYTNHAFVKAQSRSPELGKGTEADSDVAEATVTITGGSEQVIATRSCDQYLFGSIKIGGKNDPAEVSKLQQFLTSFGGFSNVSVNGVYDSATIEAVRLFQNQNAGEVLSPWGLNGPTGYVYITTRKKINDLYCQGARNFPLTDSDTNEIGTYRSYILSLKNASAVEKKIKITKPVTELPGEESSEVVTDEGESNILLQGTSTVIDSVKETATNTSAAVINATKAIGGMVTTTTKALTDIKSWFGGMKGSIKSFLFSWQETDEKVLGKF